VPGPLSAGWLIFAGTHRGRPSHARSCPPVPSPTPSAAVGSRLLTGRHRCLTPSCKGKSLKSRGISPPPRGKPPLAQRLAGRVRPWPGNWCSRA